MARLLSTLLIAFAMFCAPLAMHMNGSAMANPTAAEMGAGCEGMAHPAPDGQKSDTEANCAVACAALPGLPAVMPTEALVTKVALFTGTTQPLTGVWPEAETPPPRLAPAI